ncbi:antitoxin [Salmonella enterica]|nr:antitoxin [Salmonella enterica]ECK5423226.1 antitoxin [Salmonella enterica subsp. enterica serovar Derby]EDF8222243.1 antitoxin [Salmonella enterica subsp. enterica serovar Schwarzengrund]EEK8839188.1 antitoxin [Salmonella enterica subsp. enterica serovar Cerro]EHG6151713.1 antitoxin [Escherichia fergusonii]EIJ0599663.1 type II toxin-antitoxin system ParD family antitoxin [Salmonella enterica subsp. enterica serovar Anatum]ELL3289556.1 type II toxin-antitoxin system ParD family antitoxin [
MARTMTVDVGDELRLLREKQAESRLQQLRDLLAEGLSSGEAKPWNKDAFLNNVRARMANERD